MQLFNLQNYPSCYELMNVYKVHASAEPLCSTSISQFLKLSLILGFSGSLSAFQNLCEPRIFVSC